MSISKVLIMAVFAIPVLTSPMGPYNRRATGISVDLSTVGDTEVKAVLTNTGAESVSLLKFGTFMDPSPVQKVEVYKDDALVPFTGILARYLMTELNEDDFTTLAPGASFQTVINIAAVHAVEAGDYTVVSVGAIPYAAASSTELAGAISFQSNRLSISIDNVAAAKTAKLVPTLDKRTTLTGCSGDQDASLRAALSNAALLASAAADAASNGSSSKFNEYFKSTSSDVRASVAARLRAVASEASSTTSGSTRHYCSDPFGYCEPNVLAYTIPSQNVIANCPIYYTILSALTSACHAQDQATTTLHEFTHAPGVYSPGARDYAYGYRASAALTSFEAVNNADSYSLYANAIQVGC